MTVAPFFTLHSDLPCEGPGEVQDVAWAAALAGVDRDARVMDPACGSGADIAALLAAVPQGRVTGLDKLAHFEAAAGATHADDTRVEIRQGDIAAPGGPYDFIWCAAALYFPGVEAGLRLWRGALVPGGVVAFSEPIWLTDARPVADWSDYLAMTDKAGILAQVAVAGYTPLGTRRVTDAGWEAYYAPMQAGIAKLPAQNPEADLTDILVSAAREVAARRAHRDVFGYLIVVARAL